MSVGTADMSHSATFVAEGDGVGYFPGEQTDSTEMRAPARGQGTHHPSSRRDSHDGLSDAQQAPRTWPPIEGGNAVSEFDADRFYSALLREIDKFARKGGTGIGAGAVIKRVALEHGVPSASWRQVPRLPKSIQYELGVDGAGFRRAQRVGKRSS